MIYSCIHTGFGVKDQLYKGEVEEGDPSFGFSMKKNEWNSNH